MKKMTKSTTRFKKRKRQRQTSHDQVNNRTATEAVSSAGVRDPLPGPPPELEYALVELELADSRLFIPVTLLIGVATVDALQAFGCVEPRGPFAPPPFEPTLPGPCPCPLRETDRDECALEGPSGGVGTRTGWCTIPPYW